MSAESEYLLCVYVCGGDISVVGQLQRFTHSLAQQYTLLTKKWIKKETFTTELRLP